MRSVSWLTAVTLALAAASCDFEPEYAVVARPEQPAEPAPVASSFDAPTAGRITGRVTWPGEKPVAAPFLYGSPNPDGSFNVQMIPNPKCPTIDEKSRGVAGAVVFLRGVNPSVAKPWDLAPVRIELKDRGIRILQGDATPHRAGFVRRGDAATMRSAEPAYHVLRARGAAFFSLTFPEPDQPLARTFDKPGRVELSSGAGYYWASADLFVVEHPYYTRTNREGRFSFEQVPAGPVEVVAWLPGWAVVTQERDPETGLIFRQKYGPPVEASAKVSVEPRGSVEVNLSER